MQNHLDIKCQFERMAAAVFDRSVVELCASRLYKLIEEPTGYFGKALRLNDRPTWANIMFGISLKIFVFYFGKKHILDHIKPGELKSFFCNSNSTRMYVP